uniref:Uncharacterized protein LOC111121465 isoform X1 n=1 Tax=Crassostrea virginica TaxID=6565 RepID=A0A8B8CRM1_CRAVI|nr:uncharacterized protein LOC111121465 isoform X1 [Crassostrea virginica]
MRVYILIDIFSLLAMDIRCFTFSLVLAVTAVVDGTFTRADELESLMQRFLDRSAELPLSAEDKRGWETINFRGKRFALSKRGWEALPLFRRQRPWNKRGWESHIVKFASKRPSLFPIVDTYRTPQEPRCCIREELATCCSLCDTDARNSIFLVDPPSKQQDPCKCCDMSEEFCKLCFFLE